MRWTIRTPPILGMMTSLADESIRPTQWRIVNPKFTIYDYIIPT